MKRFAALFSIGLLVGCESAVLVNNRPERTPDWNAPATPSEPQQASGQVPPDLDMQRAQTAPPATQPAADQTVETPGVRIESNSN